jgi:acetylornithine deacetylase/succinyl-diaminopimelate desuccinylase-like protein
LIDRPRLPQIVASDVGANDSNIAVSMAIPAVAVGAVIERMPHRLEEYAEASSIVPGIKSLLALAVALEKAADRRQRRQRQRLSLAANSCRAL